MNPAINALYADYLTRTDGDKAAAASLTLADVMQTGTDLKVLSDRSLTIAEVAKRLGVSQRVVYELVQDGKIEAFKIGRAIRVQPEELAAYIERRTDRGPDALASRHASRQLGRSSRCLDDL
jgi:excisionase family DNA binding protein